MIFLSHPLFLASNIIMPLYITGHAQVYPFLGTPFWEGERSSRWCPALSLFTAKVLQKGFQNLPPATQMSLFSNPLSLRLAWTLARQTWKCLVTAACRHPSAPFCLVISLCSRPPPFSCRRQALLKILPLLLSPSPMPPLPLCQGDVTHTHSFHFHLDACDSSLQVFAKHRPISSITS